VKKPENLVSYINKAMKNPIDSITLEKFVKKHYYKIDGKSSVRLANAILQLLNIK